MKKRKGFTLIELLAVIVILAIILAIAIPSVLRLISKSKIDSYTTQIGLIKKATKLYIADKGLTSDNISVSVDDLISGNLLDSNIKNPVTNLPFETGMNVSVVRTGNKVEYGVYEGPELVTGMIPIYYDEINRVWKKADKSNFNNQWYDYGNFQWANAVTVISAQRTYYQNLAVGEPIDITNHVNTMFVWIPRYKYLIPEGTGAREIKVQFETKYDAKSTGNAVDTYYTHPAFTFGTTELNGMWVGKFESTGSITNPTTAAITIKPDLRSIRSQAVKHMYDAIKNTMQSSADYGFINDNDIHMMKNIEWGAVAYLSNSRYGKFGNSNYNVLDKEIYMNNSSSNYTGRSMGAVGGSGFTTILSDGVTLLEYSSEGYYKYNGVCAIIYTGITECGTGSVNQVITEKNLSYGASTTGTIYGIYDMSGGTYEYVMGLYKPNILSDIRDCSGFSNSYAPPISCPSTSPYDSQYENLTIDSKYYTKYLTNSSNDSLLGDGIKETYHWYLDGSGFVKASTPWLTRGGIYYNGDETGIYHYTGTSSAGAGSSARTFRVVIAPNP